MGKLAEVDKSIYRCVSNCGIAFSVFMILVYMIVGYYGVSYYNHCQVLEKKITNQEKSIRIYNERITDLSEKLATIEVKYEDIKMRKSSASTYRKSKNTERDSVTKETEHSKIRKQFEELLKTRGERQIKISYYLSLIAVLLSAFSIGLILGALYKSPIG